MIVRTHHNRDNPYVMINHTILRDPRLSWKATGLGAYLLGQKDEWEANIRHLTKQKTDGKDSVSSGLQELEMYFYLSRRQEQNAETGQIEWRADFYETYEINPAWQLLSDDERERLLAPRPGKPDTGKPYTENPTPENPDVLSNDLTNNSFSYSLTPDAGAVYKFWENNFPGTLTEYIKDSVGELIDTYGAGEVMEGMKIALLNNARTVKYVEGCCRRRAAGDDPVNGEVQAEGFEPDLHGDLYVAVQKATGMEKLIAAKGDLGNRAAAEVQRATVTLYRMNFQTVESLRDLYRAYRKAHPKTTLPRPDWLSEYASRYIEEQEQKQNGNNNPLGGLPGATTGSNGAGTGGSTLPALDPEIAARFQRRREQRAAAAGD